jgi:hypothetical protein
MSFIQKFDELMKEIDAERKTLGQCRPEWQQFMEFVAGYFRDRDIWRPVVVEIGICANAQKRFYEEIMNAEHIGIDIDSKTHPDILGDSRSPETIEALKARLNERSINLLFLDGNHTYDFVKYEYETYGPITQHLIAFHDLLCDNEPTIEINKFWAELCGDDKDHVFITFHKQRIHEQTSIWPGHEMGIGVMVKGS